MVWFVQFNQHALCVVSSKLGQWLQSGCLVCRPIRGSLPILNMGAFPAPVRVHPWHLSRREAAGSSGSMADVDSTEVVYKTGNSHCQVQQWCRC